MPGDAMDCARALLASGWCPLPVPAREKAPAIAGWQTLRIGVDDLPRYFNGGPANIGVLLGEPSCGLVDVDLDAREAVQLADLVLPPTAAVFGRASKPASHRLYVATPLVPTEKFADPEKPEDDTAMLFELRSTGCQTVFPGSVHPSGEEIRWDQDAVPATLAGLELRQAVARLAAGALLARHWPGEGARHEAALAASGFLARAGFDEALVVEIIGVIARVAGDGEWRDRQRAARDTVAALLAGTPTTGGPRLADVLRGSGEKIVRQLRRWLGCDEIERPSLTDAGNAIRFARQHGARVRYVYKWGAWLIDAGPRWKRDDGAGITVLAKETARSVYREAAAASDDERKKLAVWAIRSESEPALRRMLTLAQSEPGTPVTPAELDQGLSLLNTPSGVLELRTLHLRPARPEDLMTKITSAPYVAGARHPVFEAYLARVLPDDELRAFVQRLTGYCLTGSTVEEKVFFAHGPTATGKSTLLRALRSALGDYAAVADFSSFTEGRHRNGPREDLARLDGVRLVASVEVTDGSRLAEGLVKWLSGGDVIAARRLYEATFEFTPQFKLLLAANHRPKARSDDDALWRRILEVPFVEHIPEAERDPEVKRILCDPAEAGPAVLAWAAEGAAAWFTEGLGAPKAVRQATAAYREAMDPLKDFLADRCVVDPEAWTSAKELREAYDAWARELGIRFPLDGNTFAERLRSRGCTDRRRHGGARGWQGIRLRGPLDGDTGDGGDIECGKSLYARAQKESYGNGRHPASPVTLTDPAEPDWVRHDLFGDGSPEVAW